MSALPSPLPRSPFEGEGVRAVEAQSHVATMPLVDTLEEQELLETMIDETKGPPLPSEYHYLIATPLLRYPPLPYGSRYGTRQESGIFYGSENTETALAETAFYKLRFVDDSEGLTSLSMVMDVFAFAYRGEGTDTYGSAYDAVRVDLDSASDYATSQRLGARVREENLSIVRYRSARCPKGLANLAIFSLEALAPRPRRTTSWQLDLRDKRVFFMERNRFEGRRALAFTEAEFRENGSWAHPDAPG
ncbi:MAG: RES family NAD+ phosphorylase [Myxococcota bacterium]